ncbi:hypothetical protein AB0I68_37655 [Streptomyces sp. NPDC050448]|uniref:hypothetical protein n=1 Tax=Streptomyces sp. NPDC050448 TaxID=3155404 RepID=UPI0034309DFF
MHVDPDGAAERRQAGTATYYFCSAHCAAAFDADRAAIPPFREAEAYADAADGAVASGMLLPCGAKRSSSRVRAESSRRR